MSEEIAKILLKLKAVSLRTNPPFKWASGILSPIYTDNRILLSYPKERNQVINAFVKLIKDNKIEVDVIAGIATAGIAHAALIAKELNLPMIYVRQKKKGHGKENQIEGRFKKRSKVLVVEDLISTGGSSLEGVEGIRSAGGKVESCIAIFTYELQKASKAFEKTKVNLLTLTNFSTLVEVAVKNNYLSDKEKDNVLQWAEDPEKWR